VKGRYMLAFWLLAFALIVPSVSLAQEQDENENDPAKALALVREAIKARGGEAYLKFHTIITRGQYTAYDKGVSGDPQIFVDYVAPNRERTEFGKGDYRYVQTNSEKANWIYDGKAKQIKEQTDEQVKQFQQGSRYDLDNLLRAAALQQGVKLVYLGRREPWRSTFSEAVRIDFTDGGQGTIHFDPRSHLPLSVEYKALSEQGPVASEARYFRWVEYGGVMYPTIQDFYRDGKQSARVSFDEVNINATIPDKLFARPANVKEVK
jgi:outer membrane lipoprotein-sorting protein